MDEPSGLFGEFCDALNAELRELGCRLRVARDKPGTGETMMLLDTRGEELGWLPDHVDVASVAAFEVILDRRQQFRYFGK